VMLILHYFLRLLEGFLGFFCKSVKSHIVFLKYRMFYGSATLPVKYARYFDSYSIA
jgi:hypothetical protein